jgi:hypothetical protein
MGEVSDLFEGIGLLSMLDHTLKSDVRARRLEVLTETGRRRWFSKDDKARIVEETLASDFLAQGLTCLNQRDLRTRRWWRSVTHLPCLAD